MPDQFLEQMRGKILPVPRFVYPRGRPKDLEAIAELESLRDAIED